MTRDEAVKAHEAHKLERIEEDFQESLIVLVRQSSTFTFHRTVAERLSKLGYYVTKDDTSDAYHISIYGPFGNKGETK